MRKSYLLVLVVALFAIALSGCTREQREATETATDTAIQALETAVDTAVGAVQAMIWIDDPTLGGQVGPDGSIPTGSTDNDFKPGDPIYLAMEIGDAPAGANVRVVWSGPGATAIGEETKDVAAGQKYMNFKSPNTAKWALGDYKVEIYANGNKAHEEAFKLSRG